MPELVDVVVTSVPVAWSAGQLIQTMASTPIAVASIVIVGWCRTTEVRLVRDVDGAARRLEPLVDLVAAATRPTSTSHKGRAALTIADVPAGRRLFDELVSGRKVAVTELAACDDEALMQWLRIVGALAGHVDRSGRSDVEMRRRPDDIAAGPAVVGGIRG